LKNNNVFIGVGLVACIGAVAYAELYEMVFSGEFDSVVDNRTVENDPFAGTAWGLDNYTPQVGDTWEYVVTYDSDLVPGDLSDDFAIYGGLGQPSSTSLNGNTLDLSHNTQLYFIGHELEIFGELVSEADPQGHSFSRVYFTRSDGLDDLINGGQLFTDASVFDDLNWRGFHVGNFDGLFDLDASGETEYTVTVTQIPTPSTLALLGGAGLFAGRRRR
jgi:hypothetical protein